MATKSVLKNVDIKSRRNVIALINALENAHRKSAQIVTKQRVFSDASREEIKKMFGGNK